MRVCIVGGIFDRPETYQQQLAFLTEPLLVKGLRERGVEVETAGHHSFVPRPGFDIVHVHHLGQGAIRMATARHEAKFVYTTHHNPKLLDTRLIASQSVVPTRLLATRFVLPRADAIVALTEYERAYLRRLFVEHSSKISVIPNGLPAEQFFPPPRAEAPPAGGPYKILYVGQLIPLKGLDVLLHAIQRVGSSHDVELLLVYHNAELEDVCRRLALELGLANKVRFLGIKSGLELSELYRRVHMHVLPSFTESLPGVITEAMLSGLPVVASAVGGIPEQIGEHGALVTPGNVEELAAAIEQTLHAISEGTIDNAEIRAYAKRRFGTEAMVNSHIELYEQLARRASIPSRRRGRYLLANTAAGLAFTAIGGRVQGRGLLEG